MLCNLPCFVLEKKKRVEKGVQVKFLRSPCFHGSAKAVEFIYNAEINFSKCCEDFSRYEYIDPCLKYKKQCYRLTDQPKKKKRETRM